jgi:hypothetical protein
MCRCSRREERLWVNQVHLRMGSNCRLTEEYGPKSHKTLSREPEYMCEIVARVTIREKASLP